MRTIQTAAALMALLALQACEDAGSAGGGPTVMPTAALTPVPSPTPTSTPTPASAPSPAANTYFIQAAPERASYGANPPDTSEQGYQEAADGGPSLPGAGSTAGPVDGTRFAINMSLVSFLLDRPNGVQQWVVRPENAVNADGGTITYVGSSSSTAIYRLSLPSLFGGNFLALVTAPAPATVDFYGCGGPACSGDRYYQFGITQGLRHVQVALYQLLVAPGVGGYFTPLAFGYRTPVSRVHWGTTTFSGTNNAHGAVVLQNRNVFDPVAGNATITVDFATRAVSGSITQAVVLTGSQSTQSTWNNLSFSGTVEGNEIVGTVTIAGVGADGRSLGGTGTGFFRGGFYGPNAEEIAIVWSVRDANGSIAAGVLAEGR